MMSENDTLRELIRGLTRHLTLIVGEERSAEILRSVHEDAGSCATIGKPSEDSTATKGG